MQVAGVNLLNLALCQQPGASSGSNSTAAGLSSTLLSAHDADLMAALSGLLDHSLPLLRAKALVTVMLLCRWVCCGWCCAVWCCVWYCAAAAAAAPVCRLVPNRCCCCVLRCRLSPVWLLKCCQQKLVLHMERLTRDKDTHTQARVGTAACEGLRCAGVLHLVLHLRA